MSQVLSIASKLSDPLLLAYLKRNLTAPIDICFRNGRSGAPFLVTVQPTHRCNLRCEMCSQWGSAGNYRSGSVTLKSSLPVSQWEPVIEDLAQFKPIVLIWGGEPLIYNGILTLLEYVKERKLHCYLITNGMLLGRYARELIGLKLDGIMVSIDGPKGIHDRIRGVQGCFDNAIAGLEQLVVLREREAHRVLLVMNTVISETNCKYIREIVRVGEAAQVDVISLCLVLFITEAMGEAYQEQMKSLFGCEAHSWKGWVGNERHVDAGIIQEVIWELRINRLKRTPQVVLAPNISIDEIHEFFHAPWAVPDYTRCFQPYFEVNIQPNGDVNLCYQYPDLVVGNVVEEPFAAIWNNEKTRRLRRYLARNTFAICSKCCRFDVYPVTRYFPRKAV